MNQSELQRLIATGGALFQRQRYQEAAAVFHRATQMVPRSLSAWCNLSAACTEAGDAGRALAAANQALKLAPDFAPAHANRGDALRRGAGSLTEALAAYQRAAELQPDSADLLNKTSHTHETAMLPIRARARKHVPPLLRQAATLAQTIVRHHACPVAWSHVGDGSFYTEPTPFCKQCHIPFLGTLSNSARTCPIPGLVKTLPCSILTTCRTR